MDLPAPITDLPYLKEIGGRIVGVSFEPGRSEVIIKDEDGHIHRFSATPLQVENALDLRNSDVKAMALIQEPHSRLLRMTEVGYPWRVPSRDAAIFDRWDGLLRRLAQ